MDDLSKKYINKKYGGKTASDVTREQFAPEIQAGRSARDEYYNNLGTDQDTAIREDIKPATSYVGQKGQVSTDEPPQEPLDNQGSRDLMRLPVYQSLNRGPSSVLDAEYKPSSASQEEAPQVGRITDTEAQEDNKPSPKQLKGMGNAESDMMVGASHALLGLLSGNYNRAAMEYGKANEYVSGQKAQDIKNASNLVMTLGPDGKPQYTPKVEAADMPAYVKPIRGMSDKGYAPQKIKNKETGEIQSASWNGRNFVQYDAQGNQSRVFDPDKWAGYIPSKMQSANTMQGGKELYEVDPYTGAVTKKISVAGRGDTMGGVTKEEFDITTKGAAKGRDILAKTDQDIAAMNQARRTVQTTQDPAAFATTMGSVLRTAVGEKRLSDVEGARYMGDDYKGFMLRGEEYLRSKYGGEIPPTVRQNAINLVDYVNGKLGQQREATAKSYGGAPSLNAKGKATVKKILGTEQDTSKPTDWRSQYGI